MRHAINVTAKKVEIGYPFAPGDMKWESWRSLLWRSGPRWWHDHVAADAPDGPAPEGRRGQRRIHDPVYGIVDFDTVPCIGPSVFRVCSLVWLSRTDFVLHWPFVGALSDADSECDVASYRSRGTYHHRLCCW